MSEFIKWPKTPHWDTVRLRITQKLDGTNAQILIEKDDLIGKTHIYAGSRTRWLGTPNKNGKPDDNHGFYKWAMENKEELIEKLGPGRYYGEWCGPGIQHGENLKERGFFLFYPPKNVEELPTEVFLVPELFNDTVELDQIGYYVNVCAVQLMKSDNLIKPEGLIIQIDNQKYKWRF